MLTKESNEIPDSSKPALGYVPKKLVLLRVFTTSKETSERKKKNPNKPTHQQNCDRDQQKKFGPVHTCLYVKACQLVTGNSSQSPRMGEGGDW